MSAPSRQTAAFTPKRQKPRTAFIQPSQSEAVLAVGTHHKITGVRSTRTGPSHTYLTGKRVIELEIEVW